jgi:ribonuclease T1
MSVLGRLIVHVLILFAGLTPWVNALADRPSFGNKAPESSMTRSNQPKVKELTTVSLAELPPEAAETLNLIKQGGPFPYPKDGTVFGNREGRLPAHERGYYKEYTVKTPGSRDRGARRIIAGHKGEFYYTDDHYRTFRLIKE